MRRLVALRRVVRTSAFFAVTSLVLPVGLFSGCGGGTEAPVAKPGMAPETPAPAGFDYSKVMTDQQKSDAKKK